MIKNLPAVQETQVQSLGLEDLLVKEFGNPLQYSCLENSVDRGAWWSHKKSDMTEQLTEQKLFNIIKSTFCINEITMWFFFKFYFYGEFY